MSFVVLCVACLFVLSYANLVIVLQYINQYPSILFDMDILINESDSVFFFSFSTQ